MNKQKNVVEFYVLCNELKNVVRTGWKMWRVQKDRLESIAEHIFGTQMLAIAMWSEFEYDIDIKKVLTMLAVHETEEIVIGDLTLFHTSAEEKAKIGHRAVSEIFSKIAGAKEIENIIYEFDERITPEARFAYYCDKLECDLQCRIYDEQGLVDINNQEGNIAIKNEQVQKLRSENKAWSEMWIEFDQGKINFDEHFLSVSNYIKNNKITK